MLKSFYLFLFAFVFVSSLSSQQKKIIKVDVCVYGGTSAGVIAAYTAKQMGKSVLLIEPGKHLGGMSSGGLGFTDIGNKYVVTGLARDFYRRLGTHYGKLEQWIFEPHVAENIFNNYIKSAKIDVLFSNRLSNVWKKGNNIKQITLENSNHPQKKTNNTVEAKVFIDCTYEGDLMAKSKVSYIVGRENNSIYNETFNGVQLLDRHQFPDGIDPYIEKGNPTSGLLWGISEKPVLPNGSGDKKVQTYNFRICLTNNKDNKQEITKPNNYDPLKYELLLRLKEKAPWETLSDIFIWSKMPNFKTDINNKGGFSTDMIGMNWKYPDATYSERAKIWKQHEDYTKGLLYFVGHDPRIPEKIRTEMLQWGYPKDEYADNGHWSHQLYIREARRMIGEEVMTQQHCQGKIIIKDAIAWAAYTMDSHNCDRQVINGVVKNEGNVEEGDFPPYPISYKAIVPKRKEVNNLLVPVCLSASHIAYGSIRMEPVFMVLAQSAAVAACLSIDNNIIIQNVDATSIQRILKENPLVDKSVCEILIDNDNTEHVSIFGDWTLDHKTSSAYGANFLIDNSKSKISKSVKYTPEIEFAGKYSIYIYFQKLENGSSQEIINIFDGNTIIEKTIYQSDVVVDGQTSGEWVNIGQYNLGAGKNAYIEITNKNANNIIAADAVLFLPIKK